MNWSEIIQEHYEELYRFALRMLRSQSEAEEALQDSFEKIWRKRSFLRKKGSQRAWMFQVLRNTCLDRLRRTARSPVICAELEREAPASNPLLRLKIESFVAGLPVKQREVFLLRKVHGFSTEEAAKLLKIRPGTVKSHLKRAMDTLRTELADERSEGAAQQGNEDLRE